MRAIVKVYADLICKGIRTFASILDKDKELVKQELIERGREDLTTDTE